MPLMNIILMILVFDRLYSLAANQINFCAVVTFFILLVTESGHKVCVINKDVAFACELKQYLQSMVIKSVYQKLPSRL